MARKKSPNLTEAELRLMQVIWEKGSATVASVAEALRDKPELAYNTVLEDEEISEKELKRIRKLIAEGGK